MGATGPGPLQRALTCRAPCWSRGPRYAPSTEWVTVYPSPPPCRRRPLSADHVPGTVPRSRAASTRGGPAGIGAVLCRGREGELDVQTRGASDSSSPRPLQTGKAEKREREPRILLTKAVGEGDRPMGRVIKKVGTATRTSQGAAFPTEGTLPYMSSL